MAQRRPDGAFTLYVTPRDDLQQHQPGQNQAAHEQSSNKRRRKTQIQEALRVHCGIEAKEYLIIAIDEQDAISTFTNSPDKFSNVAAAQFLNGKKSQEATRTLDQVDVLPISEYPNQTADVPQYSSEAFGSSRALYQYHQRVPSESSLSSTPAPKKRSAFRKANIQDSEAIYKLYEALFAKCQQVMCKMLAKAWIKVVEPKKQSLHPYTGGEETAPDWWPRRGSGLCNVKVRHKEPDHLYKPERLRLLVHILRHIAEPAAKQPASIRSQRLNIQKLQDATTESMTLFFASNNSNLRKRSYLDDIFMISRQEERFRHGEIKGSTEVQIDTEEMEFIHCHAESASVSPRGSPSPAQPTRVSAQAIPYPVPSWHRNASVSEYDTQLSLTGESSHSHSQRLSHDDASFHPHAIGSSHAFPIESRVPATQTSASLPGNVHATAPYPSHHALAKGWSEQGELTLPGDSRSQAWPLRASELKALPYLEYMLLDSDADTAILGAFSI